MQHRWLLLTVQPQHGKAGVDTDCFRHRYTDFGTLIWPCPNQMLSKSETTVNTISVFWSNQQHNLNIMTRKYKIN